MTSNKIINAAIKRTPTPLLIVAAVVIVALAIISDFSSVVDLLPSKEGEVLSDTIALLKQEASPTPVSTPNPIQKQTVLVTRIVDGDTIEIEGGQKIRYIGIDTPESVHPSKPVQCFSKEATERNRQLVEGKEIQIEKDVNETDRYGRLLRYIYVDGVMINQQLVEEGFAQASAYPPDVKYQDLFDKAQQTAQQENRGLWGDICLKS